MPEKGVREHEPKRFDKNKDENASPKVVRNLERNLQTALSFFFFFFFFFCKEKLFETNQAMFVNIKFYYSWIGSLPFENSTDNFFYLCLWKAKI